MDQTKTYEDFQPSTDWTHELNCDVLLVDLPGFKKEEIKVQVDNSWRITISGERLVGENKYCRFKQVSDAPKDSEIDKISGRFDGGLLFVIIPKKAAGEEPKNMNQNAKDAAREKKQELVHKEDDNKHKKKVEMEKVGLKEDLNAQKRETKVVEHLTENGKEGEVPKEQGKEAAGDFAVNAKIVINKHSGWRKEAEDITEEGKEGVEGFMANAKGRFSKKEGWRKERDVVKEKRKQVVEAVEDFMGNAMEVISNNKVAIATTIFAFSIGVVYVSHRLRSGGQ